MQPIITRAGRLNRRHPWAKRVRFCWSAVKNVESITGATGTIAAGATLTSGKYGKARGLAGVSFSPQNISFTPNTKNALNSSVSDPGMTLFVVLNNWVPNGNPGSSNNNGNLIAGTAGASSGLSINNSGALQKVISGSLFATSSRTLTSGQPAVVAVTHKYLVGGNFWINGVPETAHSDGLGFAGSFTPQYIGGTSGQSSIQADIAAVIGFDTILPSEAIEGITQSLMVANKQFNENLHRMLIASMAAASIPTQTVNVTLNPPTALPASGSVSVSIPAQTITVTQGTLTPTTAAGTANVSLPGLTVVTQLQPPGVATAGSGSLTIQPGGFALLPGSNVGQPGVLGTGYVLKNPLATSGNIARWNNDWSGFVYDPDTKSVWSFNGGHNDQPDNPMVKTEVLNQRTIIARPSDVYTAVAPFATSGQQLYWATPGNASPLQRHVYAGPVYVPTIQKVLYPDGALVSHGNASDLNDWLWNPRTNAWEILPGSDVVHMRGQVSGAATIWDSKRGRVLYLHAGVVIGATFAGLTPSSPLSAYPSPTVLYSFNDSNAIASACYVVSQDFAFCPQYGGPQFFFYDLGNPSTPYQRKTVGAITGDIPDQTIGQFACCYDAGADKIVLWDGFNQIWELTYTGRDAQLKPTFSSHHVDLAAQGLPASLQPYNTAFGSAQAGFGKAKYMPDFGTIILCRASNDDQYVIYRTSTLSGNAIVPFAGASNATAVAIPGLTIQTIAQPPSVPSAAGIGVTMPQVTIASGLNVPTASSTISSPSVHATTAGSGPIAYATKLNPGEAMPGTNFGDRQVDVWTTWSDGSIAHMGVVEGVTNGTPSLANLIATGWDAVSTWVIAGVTYTNSAITMLQSGTPLVRRTGAKCTEWWVRAPLGGTHPHLSVSFQVQYFTDGHVWVRPCFENVEAYVASPAHYLASSVTLTVGGTTVINRTNFNHWSRSRWTDRFWWPNVPSRTVTHDMTYLIAQGAINNYDRTTPVTNSDIVAFDATPQLGANGRYDYLRAGLCSGATSANLGNTGSSNHIGPLPAPHALYVITQDQRMWNTMLLNGDLAGTWGVHYRDTNGYPVSWITHPYATIFGGPGNGVNPATGQNEYLNNMAVGHPFPDETSGHGEGAHAPAMAYLPYLLTGDYYYLEEMAFWVSTEICSRNSVYRGDDGVNVVRTRGLIYSHPNNMETRTCAWVMRNMVEFDALAPTSYPLKLDVSQTIDNNMAFMVSRLGQPGNSAFGDLTEANNPLHIFEYWRSDAPADPLNRGVTTAPPFAPWQHHNLVGVYGRMIELGRNVSQATTLLSYFGKIVQQAMNPAITPNWKYYMGYQLAARVTATSTVYMQTVEEMLTTTYGNLSAIPLDQNGNPTFWNISDGTGNGYEMITRWACAAVAGFLGDSVPWTTYQSRTSKTSFGINPQYAINPRSLGVSPPPPPPPPSTTSVIMPTAAIIVSRGTITATPVGTGTSPPPPPPPAPVAVTVPTVVVATAVGQINVLATTPQVTFLSGNDQYWIVQQQRRGLIQQPLEKSAPETETFDIRCSGDMDGGETIVGLPVVTIDPIKGRTPPSVSAVAVNSGPAPYDDGTENTATVIQVRVAGGDYPYLWRFRIKFATNMGNVRQVQFKLRVVE